jgi:hypothetical protein
MVFHARCYCHAAVWLVEAEIAPSYFKTRLVYQVRYRLKSWARFFRGHPFRYRGAPARSSVSVAAVLPRTFISSGAAVHPRMFTVQLRGAPAPLTRFRLRGAPAHAHPFHCRGAPAHAHPFRCAVLPPTLFRFRCRGAPAHAHPSRCAMLPRTLIRFRCRGAIARAHPSRRRSFLRCPLPRRIRVSGRIQVRVRLRFSRFPRLCQVGFRLLAPLSVFRAARTHARCLDRERDLPVNRDHHLLHDQESEFVTLPTQCRISDEI